MNRIDLIIDALESAYEDKAGWCDKVNEALYAAQELKALKPVAWLHPDKKVDVIVPSSLAWFDKPKPLYALDEVTVSRICNHNFKC